MKELQCEEEQNETRSHSVKGDSVRVSVKGGGRFKQCLLESISEERS